MALVGLWACEYPHEENHLSSLKWLALAHVNSFEPAPTRMAELHWQAPLDCPFSYRVVSELTGKQTGTQTSFVNFYPLRPTSAKPSLKSYPLPGDEAVEISLEHVHDARAKSSLQVGAISGALIGPASIDAPCLPQTEHPLQESLAIAWPQLPARAVLVGETWQGARVEGRCNRSATLAVNEQGQLYQPEQIRPGVTMAWQERLVGIYTFANTQVAVVASMWSDGHPLDVGIWSERMALISIDHGRLLASTFTLHHAPLDFTRTVHVTAVDTCKGSLGAAE